MPDSHRLGNNYDHTVGSAGTTSVVAIATCAALPDGDEDAPLLAAALAARSVAAQWCVWTDPSVDWDRFELTVIRSTWDYTADRAAFLQWAGSTPRLHNPAAVLAWNSDKSYLRDLAGWLIPTVPTTWLEPGERLLPPAGEYVLKPTVGAGSKGAGRFDGRAAGSAARAGDHLRSLHEAGRTVMVQPYLADVDVAGEAALVYLGGRFSHAITKRAMLGRGDVNALEPGYSRSLYVEERISARGPTGAELELGARVIAAIGKQFGELVYARVDLLPTADGPVVIEVELTEPSLFLGYDRTSADRLAAALAARLTQS
jgi:glutathione synthase/RimK-type ligase-like ATP-grasp enzyme